MKPLSLRRRKVRALRIFKQPIFRRNLATPKVAQEALEILKTKLTDFNSFYKNTTKLIDSRASPNIRLFKYKGFEFAVKNTGGDWFQGHSSASFKKNEIRAFIKMHHTYFRDNELRKKKSYILRTPKLFGVIGNFLILEKINRWNPKTKEEIDAYYLAHEQMGTVFQTLAASREIEKPQVNDFIPAGIYKGKVVFYTVYDYL